MNEAVALILVLLAGAFAVFILKWLWDYFNSLGTMSWLLFIIAVLLTVIIFKLDSIGV